MQQKVVFLCGLMLYTSMIYAQNIKGWIGTYSLPHNPIGIYSFQWNQKTGSIRIIDSVAMSENASWMCKTKDHLYAVDESNHSEGRINVFSIQPHTLKLLRIQQKASLGDSPCYISLSHHHTWLAVANYGSGNVSVYSIQKNGYLDSVAQNVIQYGTPLSMSHQVFFKSNDQLLCTVNLGRDQIITYSFKRVSQQPVDTLAASIINCSKGSGPRHVWIDRKHIFVAEELGGIVEVFKKEKNRFMSVQKISTQATAFNKIIATAEIQMSKNRRFLYVSNRGDANNITIFRVIKKHSYLRRLGSIPVGGICPRFFMISPNGQFLLVANQYSNNVIVFKLSKRKGQITKIVDAISLHSPVFAILN